MIYWLLCGADFCLFAFSFVLLFKWEFRDFPRLILGTVFFICGWYVFMSLLILSGSLVHFPFLFRSGMPFYYLAAPLLYIYVRCKGSGENGLRKYDWIHFVPAILAFVDLFPYYFLTSLDFKKNEMVEYAANHASVVWIGRGILPPSVHYCAWTTLGMGYFLYQWLLLFKLRFDHKNKSAVDCGTRVISELQQ